MTDHKASYISRLLGARALSVVIAVVANSDVSVIIIMNSGNWLADFIFS